ncbi:MAG: hypothetical protein ACMG6H_14495, partial [Acidobacteriota bacterium]
MNVHFPRAFLPNSVVRYLSLLLAMVLFASPLCAQQPAAKPPAQREASSLVTEPAFESLLAVDSYKLYGEIRNVGQLMSSGGLG